MLDQGLRYRCVHVVMRHLVPNSIGGPSQGELAKVARPQNQSVVKVRQAEQVRGSFPGLDIFKSDVMNRLRFCKWMADVLEHLDTARADVDFFALHAEGLHEFPG